MPLASLALFEAPFVPPVSDDVCRVVQLITRPVDRELNTGLFSMSVRLAACRVHMIDILSGGGERGNALEVWDRVMMHIGK